MPPLELRDVHANQRLRREHLPGLLERFAHDRLEQRFARLQVTSRLVQPQPVRRVLLDQQEPLPMLDDGGHGHVRRPQLRIHKSQYCTAVGCSERPSHPRAVTAAHPVADTDP